MPDKPLIGLPRPGRWALRCLAWCAAVLLSVPAGAQMNRCTLNGKTVIQEAPCPGVRRADSLPVAGSAPAAGGEAADDPNPIAVGKKLCRDGAPKLGGWNDPERLKVSDAVGGKMTVIEFASRQLAARQFFVGVNARNEYGVYTGEKSVICYTSEDGRRILKVEGI